jgi:hypothetical protein
MVRLAASAVASYGCRLGAGTILVLPITKRFFDEILAGTKEIEYRKAVPFYDRLLSSESKERIDTIYLHYRHGVFMRCDVTRIARIKRPKKLENSVHITTPHCYAISVRSPEIVKVELI